MTQAKLSLKIEPTQPERVYHTWDQWECYPAGFHETTPPFSGWDADDAKQVYAEFFRSPILFRAALERVLEEWPNSCEHNLTNQNHNRLAWLGQAAVCIAFRIPQDFRGGFYLLTQEEQDLANDVALEYLNKWLEKSGHGPLNHEQAKSRTQANLY